MNRLRRLSIVVLLVVTAAVASAARTFEHPVQAHLADLPYTLDGWTGANAAPIDDDTARVLGADAYLTRTYTARSGTPVDLYMAFYATQRPGVSIHSPLHCLPGSGWEPLDVATVDVTAADGTAGHVRRMIIRKNRDNAVVLYWYAVHGRAIASELTSKLWLLHDALRLHRSDAALVRIVVPADDSVAAAEQRGLAFARRLLPFVPQLWS